MNESKNVLTPTLKILRPPQAAAYIGVSRTTLHRMEHSDPSFPKKIKISARCVGWRVSDLDQWLSERESAQ